MNKLLSVIVAAVIAVVGRFPPSPASHAWRADEGRKTRKAEKKAKAKPGPKRLRRRKTPPKKKKAAAKKKDRL